MRYTAEEVREHAEFLHECMLNGITDPAPELRCKHQDKIAAMLTAYAALLERSDAGVTEDAIAKAAMALAQADGDDPHELIWEGNPPEPWGEVWNKYEGTARTALLAVWPIAAEQAQPVERRWTGPGYLEQTGYIDPQPGEHVSDAESLLRSAAQKAVRANFDLRVRNNEIVGLLSEVLGFIGNVTDDERDIANRITKCLGATFVTEPLRPGYVRCQKCEAQMGGYGYGKFPKLCPVCQDISTKPAEPVVQGEVPDPQLCKFYGVSTFPQLVQEMEQHIAKLQDDRPKKPWEDAFPSRIG